MIDLRLIFLVMFVMVSCSTIPSVDSDFDSSYDLSKYKTYSLESLKGIESSSQISLNPILIQRVHRSIEKNLDLKNIKLSDNPDILIKVLVGMDREVSSSHDSSSYLYPHYGWRDTNTRYYQKDNQSISIRAYDANTNEVVWYAFSRFRKSSNFKDQDSIDLLVKNMLSNFLN